MALQETERELLVGELEGDLLKSVLDLWREIQPSAGFTPSLRAHCREVSRAFVSSLRTKIVELRNPILEGATLAEVFPEGKLDETVSQVTGLTALLSHKIVSESLQRLGARPEELELRVNGEWLLGMVKLRKNPESSHIAHWKRLARLVGGRVSMEVEERGLSLRFEFPNALGGP